MIIDGTILPILPREFVMALSIPETTNIATAEGERSTRLEVLSAEALEVVRLKIQSWGQILYRTSAICGDDVIVCITLDLGVTTQVHVTCSPEAADDLLGREYRAFKVKLTDEGLAISDVASSLHPDGYIPCRRDAYDG